MKSFKKLISEVAQPRERGAEEEQAFKDQHTYEVIPHPVALDTQFTGDIQKPQAMRPADNKGDHTYDKAYAANVTGFEEFDESVESVDEGMMDNIKKKANDMRRNVIGLSQAEKDAAKKKQMAKQHDSTMKNIGGAMSAVAKKDKAAEVARLKQGLKNVQDKKNEETDLVENPAEEIPMMKTQLDFICTAATAISKALGNNDPEEWYQNKLATAHEAMKTLHANIVGKNEDVNESKDMSNAKALDKASSASKEGKKAVSLKKAPWDKTEELKGGQKKLDHNKNGKIDGHDFAVMRARKKNESVEHLGEDKSEEAADQHEYETDEHRDHADDHAKAAKMHAAKAKSSKDSSVANKHKAASAAHDKAREHALDAAHYHQAAADAHRDKDSGAKKATKTADHHSSLHYAASEKADAHSSKLTEAVAETTNSALMKPVTTTGPDGKKRTVMKTVRNNRTDDRGQDVITTKESVEQFDEAYRAGIVKFKDGKQKIIKKQDADLLNKMLKDLSPASRRSMSKVAETDEAGFDEILGFAREAL